LNSNFSQKELALFGQGFHSGERGISVTAPEFLGGRWSVIGPEYGMGVVHYSGVVKHFQKHFVPDVVAPIRL